MEDQPQHHPLRHQPQHPRYFPTNSFNNHIHHHQIPHKTSSSFRFSTFKKLLVIACMLTLSFIYFTLASLSFAAALLGLVITVPLLILFSPVLVPALIVIGFAVTGFLSSGAVGLAAGIVLFWVYYYIQMTLTG